MKVFIPTECVPEDTITKDFYLNGERFDVPVGKYYELSDENKANLVIDWISKTSDQINERKKRERELNNN